MVITAYYIERYVFLSLFSLSTVLYAVLLIRYLLRGVPEPKWTLKWVAYRLALPASAINVVFSIDPSGVFNTYPPAVRYFTFVNGGALLLIEAFAEAYGLTKINYAILRVPVPKALPISLISTGVFYLISGNLVFVAALIKNEEPLWGLGGIFFVSCVVFVFFVYVVAVGRVIAHINESTRKGIPATKGMTRATGVLLQLRRGFGSIGIATIGFCAWCAYTLTDNNSWEPNPDQFDGRFTFVMSNSAVNFLFRLWFFFGNPSQHDEGTNSSGARSHSSDHKKAGDQAHGPPSPTSGRSPDATSSTASVAMEVVSQTQPHVLNVVEEHPEQDIVLTLPKVVNP